MKIKIATTIPIKKAWTDEVLEFIPTAQFEIVKIKQLPKVYWKNSEQSMYGDFNSVRAIVDGSGVQARMLIMSYKQLRDLGIVNHLALYDNSDRDGVLDTYIGLADKLDFRAKENGFRSNFAWEVCHELSHGVEQNLGREYLAISGDRTHAMEAVGKLKELWVNNEKETIVKLETILDKLKKIVADLLNKPTIIHPLRLPFRNQITQQYGVENPIYSRTNRHIGCDYGCLIGTPIAAPQDGELIVATSSPQRGNYIQFKHGNYVLEVRHLFKMLPLGRYKLGQVIGYTGNTGNLTTGPHACVVCWVEKDNIDIINKTNWSTLTVDPNKLYI